jgi:hypothetical protein
MNSTGNFMTPSKTADADLRSPAAAGPAVLSVAAWMPANPVGRGAIRSERVRDQFARALRDALPSHDVHAYPGTDASSDQGITRARRVRA